MSTQSNNVSVVRTTSMAQHFALGDLLEQVQISRPIEGVISSKISLTEADSNSLIDSAAKAIKFKEIDGDQDNSFNEGKDEDPKLDENGNFVGKGKTTIFDKKVDLKDPENSTERWVETSTGKVSDGETEQIPTMQGEKTATLNENDGNLPMDFSDDNPDATIGETKSDDLDPKHKAPDIEDSKKTKVNPQGALKSLLGKIPAKK